MARAWRVARVAGVDIRLHWTFVLMPLLFGYAYGVRGLVIVGFVFLCVTLHELCHSMQARAFGIATQDIMLYPIGGVAQLHSFGHHPRQEWLTTLAGPLFNFALAVVSYAPVRALVGPELLWHPDLMFRISADSWRHVLVSCFWVNPLLGLFNLIPAFPMDGGRLLRSFLAERLGMLRATRVAVWVGRVFMVGFILAGLAGNLWLLVMALFLYGAGKRELMQQEQLHAAYAQLLRARTINPVVTS